MTPRKQIFPSPDAAPSQTTSAAAAPVVERGLASPVSPATPDTHASSDTAASPPGESCSLPAADLDGAAAAEAAAGETEAVLDVLAQQVSKLSRISQQLSSAMSDLEPSLAYPQVYAPANESDLRQQVRALEPQLSEARSRWVAQRAKASHAQMRRAGDLIKRAERMCEGLRPVVVQSSSGMVDGDGSRMHRDYQRPAIVVRPGEVMAQASAKRGS